MGTTSSIEEEHGVTANPRVVYSLEQQKKENLETAPVIDTPVLVDLGHGTIRYRYVKQDVDSRHPGKRIEDAHIGDENVAHKAGYFYHARLGRAKQDPLNTKPGSYKNKYVIQGPTRHKGKRVYYVYGKGLGSQEDQNLPPRAHPARPPQREKVWTQGFRLPDHEYFLIQLLSESDSPLQAEDQEQTVMDEDPDPSKPFSVPVSVDQTVADIRSVLSLRILKSSEKVHLGLISAESELGAEENIWKCLRPDEDPPASFKILVTRVGTK